MDKVATYSVVETYTLAITQMASLRVTGSIFGMMDQFTKEISVMAWNMEEVNGEN